MFTCHPGIAGPRHHRSSRGWGCLLPGGGFPVPQQPGSHPQTHPSAWPELSRGLPHTHIQVAPHGLNSDAPLFVKKSVGLAVRVLLQVLVQEVFLPEAFSHGLDLRQRDSVSGRRRRVRRQLAAPGSVEPPPRLVITLCISQVFLWMSSRCQGKPPNRMDRGSNTGPGVTLGKPYDRRSLGFPICEEAER